MEVILQQPVKGLGEAGEVVRVKPGYAHNFLIPRGLAVEATPQQRKASEQIQRQRALKVQYEKANAELLKQKIERQPITLTLNIGPESQTFGSVTMHDIFTALRTEGFQIEKNALKLEEPIKALGRYEIPIRLHPEVIAALKLSVVKA
ncbi:MAG: 50S ribosomal protein L9 [Candidatus Omnitrophica bacterium]|nr:50S ribosomal protein L9 [Candidatus Omnitrophota bacterium]MBI2174006.1 50S ribosomal protein L9 [Candidatus Omnitrophota bacterium]MBI3009807.1 50S ribosomal protein L9 [Candidatus Omnitrophota bacterium]